MAEQREVLTPAELAAITGYIEALYPVGQPGDSNGYQGMVGADLKEKLRRLLRALATAERERDRAHDALRAIRVCHDCAVCHRVIDAATTEDAPGGAGTETPGA